MIKTRLFILLIFIFSFQFILASYEDCSIYGTCKPTPTYVINETQFNVNNSIYWDGHAFVSGAVSSIETDPLSVHTDQTTPQDVINGFLNFILGIHIGTNVDDGEQTPLQVKGNTNSIPCPNATGLISTPTFGYFIGSPNDAGSSVNYDAGSFINDVIYFDVYTYDGVAYSFSSFNYGCSDYSSTPFQCSLAWTSVGGATSYLIKAYDSSYNYYWISVTGNSLLVPDWTSWNSGDFGTPSPYIRDAGSLSPYTTYEWNVYAYRNIGGTLAYSELPAYVSQGDEVGAGWKTTLSWDNVGADGYILNSITNGYYIELSNVLSYEDDGTYSAWTYGTPTVTPNSGTGYNNFAHFYNDAFGIKFNGYGQIDFTNMSNKSLFIIPNTLLNTNLNADLVDGKHANELGNTSFNQSLTDSLYYSKTNPDGYYNSTTLPATNLSDYALLNGSNFTGNITAPNMCYANGTNCNSTGYAQYQYTNNSFNGSGDFQTIGGNIIATGGISYPELITNGGFANGNNWTGGTGWTFSAGRAKKSADGNGSLTQAVNLTAGQYYRITYTLFGQPTGAVIGGVNVSIGGVNFSIKNEVSLHATMFKALVNETNLTFTPNGNTDRFGIDSVFLKQVTGIVGGGQFNFEGNTGDVIGQGARVTTFNAPAKASFRSGEVSGTQWDENNIGKGSTSFGFDTLIKGIYSFGSGQNVTMLGANSFANGLNIYGNGSQNNFIGWLINGYNDNQNAMGYNLTLYGNGDTAIGFNSIVSGFIGQIFGSGLINSGDYSTLFGSNCSLTLSKTFAIGYDCSGLPDFYVTNKTTHVNNVNVNGNLTLNNTVWEDMTMPINTGKTVGSTNVPSFDVFKNGTYAYAFVSGDQIFATQQMSHSYKLGSSIYQHTHIVPSSTNTGNVTICIEYTKSNIGSVFPDTTTSCGTTYMNGTASQHILQMDGNIGNFTGLSGIINARIFRNATTIGSAYADKIFILAYDLHYEKDSIGSNEELVK